MKRFLTVLAVIALVAVLGITLLACTPDSAEKAKEKMEEAGYTVKSDNIPDALKAVGVDGYIVAENENGAYLEAIHFKSRDEAKAYRDEQDEMLKAKANQYSAAFENITFERVSTWIVLGTEEAVDAFKK